jgi:putative acetyltransferase
MTERWSIRSTHLSDRPSVLGVVREAFASGDRDGQEEVDIVVNTWSLHAGVSGLDMVAEVDGVVVGHVLGAFGDLDGQRCVGVAPLAVAPARQRQGVGTALMHEAIRRAEDNGEPLLLLLGLPAYYGRFGFEAAGPLGIDYPRAGLGNPHFLVRKLARYSPVYRGVFRYSWESSSR